MNEQQDRLNKALEKYGDGDSEPARKVTNYKSVEEEILFTVRDIKSKVTFLFVLTIISLGIAFLGLISLFK